MAEPALFRTIDMPFCQAVQFEHWNAAPGRFFVAVRTRGAFTAMLGNGVVEEFRTLSGPVLLAPASALGGIYDAGLRLADARSLDAQIDQGWPPLTIGIDVTAPARPADWIALFLDAIRQQKSAGTPPWQNKVRAARVADYRLQRLHCHVDGKQAATIIATDAPLLPQQLQRLADRGDAPVSLAVSLGNRLPRVDAGEMQQLTAVSEQTLALLVASARRLVSA
ncbi:MAG: P1 family peptidase [Gammaproteobacteria bacterium]|nr:P1 family peptidase [Gammaproteobacteria bacterium]MDH5303701.1 P1 family peptidase [Gammaproteobacteria bacterium]MDH5322670.1 P1 family peptidase [Gammaproteobacteria bacterium]